MKILCVEDEAAIREDLTDVLEEEGFTVIQAVNGEDALTKIEADLPDLVLSDISMPKMNGHELLQALQAQSPKYDDLPFIFLSAHSDRRVVLEGMELGADDYLTKPVDFELMLTRINTVLRRVTRMKDKKEQEQVKLYKALTGREEEPVEPPFPK